MEIYQLRYFLAVAETGNFTKAAGRVFVSQPSLSQQILNLEEELGQKLFHRMGRKAVLTDAGLKLLESSRRILADVDQTLQELKESTGLGPKVKVGALQTVAHFFFPLGGAFFPSFLPDIGYRNYIKIQFLVMVHKTGHMRTAVAV